MPRTYETAPLLDNCTWILFGDIPFFVSISFANQLGQKGYDVQPLTIERLCQIVEAHQEYITQAGIGDISRN